MPADDAGLPGRHRRTGRHRPHGVAAPPRQRARHRAPAGPWHRAPDRLAVPVARGGIAVGLGAALAISVTTAGSGTAGDGSVRPLPQRAVLVEMAEPAQQALQVPAGHVALRSVRSTVATARDAARAAQQVTLARARSMDAAIDLVEQGGEGVRAAAESAQRREDGAGVSRTGEREEAPQAQVEQVVAPAPQYSRPVTGRLTSRYGYRWGRLHRGIDYGAAYGASVRSVAAGTVEMTGWSGGLGYQARVRTDDGALVVYGHLSRIGVSSGQRVTAGQWVGAVGSSGRSTGPHLHLEVHVGGVAVDPIPWLAARGIAP